MNGVRIRSDLPQIAAGSLPNQIRRAVNSATSDDIRQAERVISPPVGCSLSDRQISVQAKTHVVLRIRCR